MNQNERNHIIIYADKREMNSKIFTILIKRCEVREKMLNVADYQLSERVACERKTVNDFLQSLIDHRLFEQLTRLKDSFDRPLLIIEGEENLFESRRIHENAINGALASITIDMGVPIIWTRNQLETANLLYVIARREQIQMKKSISIRGKRKFLSKNQEQEFLLSGLPKVSGIIAKRLLKHFGTPEKIFTATEKELMEVEGIGKKMAKNIRNLLSRKYEKSILED